MNQDWQEEKIKQLFHKLREQDRQHAPAFASVLEAALANRRQTKSVWQAWRLAFAVALIIVVISSVFFFIKPFSEKPKVEPLSAATQTVPLPMPVPSRPNHDVVIPTPNKSRSSPHRHATQKRLIFAQHNHLPTRKLQPGYLISKWQSPTDGLLKTPGAELFRAIPRVGEPLFEMKSFFPNEKN